MKFRYSRLGLGILLILSLFNTSGFADLDRSKIKKGIRAFDTGQWDESLQHFQDALLDDPENPVGHYNVGEALYKKKNYEEALKSYERVLNTDNPTLKEMAHYNLGNTYYQMNKYQEAIQSYIKALDLDPEDQDAKHNLELVRAKLKEMAQKQPQQNQPQPQTGEQEQKSGSGEQENNSGQQQQQPQEQQQQEQQQSGDQQEKQNQEEQPQEAQGLEKQKELSKEEAERILQALRSEEKENQKLRRTRRPSSRGAVEKDW